MSRLTDLAAELEALRTEMLELDAAKEPTEEQTARMESILPEWDEKKAAHDALVERTEKVEAVRSSKLFDDESNLEHTAPDVHISRTSKDPFDPEFMERMDNASRGRWGGFDASEMVGRASDAVERTEYIEDDQKEHVTRMLEGKTLGKNHSYHNKTTRFGIAEHVLRTGSDDYFWSFQRYLEDPEGYASRAALSLTSANGGYLVPFTLDPSIILTNVGSANPFRQISGTRTTTTNNWNGVTSAGVNAGWLAEGTEDTDHSPTVGTLQITPQKASAWVFGSYEILEDSDFAQQFPTLMADAKDRLEEAAFATGTGGTQPNGVVPRATTVTSIGAGAYAIGDTYAVQQALPARFRGPQSSVAWVANLTIINKTRQFDTAGGSSYWTNLGLGQPEQLLGKPFYESTTMVSTITTGSKNLLVGDFSQYLIVDRVGMSVLYEPMVKGVTNARPTGQAGWFAFWRVGADVTTTSAFRVLVEA